MGTKLIGESKLHGSKASPLHNSRGLIGFGVPTLEEDPMNVTTL